MANLQKLRQECSEVKALMPTSESSETSDPPRDLLSDLDSDSLPQTPSTGSSPTHEARRISRGQGDIAGLDFLSAGARAHDMEADLDLLPTKEEVMKHIGDGDGLGERDSHFRQTDVHVSTKFDEPESQGASTISKDHTDKHSNEDEDEHEDQRLEKSCLLGDPAPDDDHETAHKLQTFIESVTSKLLERNHNSRTASSTSVSGSGDSVTSELRDIRVSSGTSSPSTGIRLASPTKQPLLQEMSAPIQEHTSDEKSVAC